MGAIASAYNRVDDIAGLATNDAISAQQDYAQHVMDLYTGLYVVGVLPRTQTPNWQRDVDQVSVRRVYREGVPAGEDQDRGRAGPALYRFLSPLRMVELVEPDDGLRTRPLAMTSQGTAHGRFARAIRERHLGRATMAARELERVSLADALALSLPHP